MQRVPYLIDGVAVPKIVYEGRQIWGSTRSLLGVNFVFLYAVVPNKGLPRGDGVSAFAGTTVDHAVVPPMP